MAASEPKTTARRLAALDLQRTNFAEVAQDARDAASWNAAVQALAKVREVDTEIERVRATQEVGRVKDPERRLRRAAELALMDGSFTAAAGLEREAEQMRVAREAEEARRREEEQRDVRVLLAEIERTVEVLPERLRDEWIDALVAKWRR